MCVEGLLVLPQPRHHLTEAPQRQVMVARHAEPPVQLAEDGLVRVASRATARGHLGRDRLDERADLGGLRVANCTLS